MTAFLSADFLDEARRVLTALDPVGDIDTSIQYVVSGAPDGKLHVAVIIEGGRVVDVVADRLDDPPITCTLTYDEACAIVTGETTADAAFMRGAIKVEGAHAVWLLGLRGLRAAALPAIATLID